MMRLTCAVGGTHPCGQPAVAVLLTEDTVHTGSSWDGWHHKDVITAFPMCEDHAPEEVHEARCSMHEDEFLVLTLPITEPTSTDVGVTTTEGVTP